MTRTLRVALTLGAIACVTPALHAQSGAKPPIADNSFLMEEAYNQEKGVVQHISVFQKVRDGDTWAYGFTQEWPVGGQRHQFSYTVPLMNVGPSSGFGDLMLNWRYQLIGSGEEPTWISPRISVILPTGDDKKGLGDGALGVQGAIPLSHRWSDQLVSHTNAGLTLIPGATGGDMTSVSLGHSFIWEPLIRTNFMLEAVWNGTSRNATGGKTWDAGFYVSPGVRWGYDFPSGLQVVPGFAFPIGVGPSKNDNHVLLYLSFEHPFTSNR